MDENENAAAAIVAKIARIDAIPLLLPLAYEISAMRVAILVPVAGDVWTAGAVHDGSFDVRPVEQLTPGEPLLVELGLSAQPIFITKNRLGLRGQ